MDDIYKIALSFEGREKIQFGDGYYADVCQTDQLKFGELHIPPHGKAGYDEGHPGADEVFYIADGAANVYFPESGETESVRQGQYILIPRGKPHEVSNPGDGSLKLLYFCTIVE